MFLRVFIGWETSDLKAWLEREFLPGVFTDDERSFIREVTCLSSEEAERYFRDDEDRICKPTPHAVQNLSWDEGCYWWLRSRGTGDAMFAAFVRPDGSIDKRGGSVAAFRAVRPALRLHL